MFNYSILTRLIRLVFHFALMQNETKDQGFVPRRPKTAATAEQNKYRLIFSFIIILV